MNVLIVTPDYPPPPGGIQNLTKNMELGLESLGHDVRILHEDPDDPLSIGDYVPRVLLDDFGNVGRWPYYNRLYRESRRMIAEFEPDIVHTTHIVCWPALKAASERNIPGVVTAHALELSESGLAKSAASRADRVHAVSEFTSGLTQSVTDISSDKITVIPPSIAVPDEIPSANPDGPVFCISRLVERKNLVTLVEAWQQLPDSLRNKHGLVIAGDGEQKSHIEGLAAADDTIEVAGRISEDEKNRYLEDAALFALIPIRDEFDVEGFGIVYIEAQANGTPVLGSNTGGVPEAVGTGGVVVDDPLDSSEAADKLRQLLTDDDLRERKHAQLKDRINQYDITAVAELHIEMYQNLLDGGAETSELTVDLASN